MSIADSFVDEDHPLMRDDRGMTIILADDGGMKSWDREVAPRLHRVQSYAQFAMGDAREIVRGLRGLPIIPQFETKALTMVDSAISDLRDALTQLESAREQYKSVTA